MTDKFDFDKELPFPAVPRSVQKLVDSATEIATIQAEEATFLHTIMCQCGLPRAKVEGTSFERTSGAASLLIESGKINDGFGNWKDAPLPYGAKPRLVLFHLCTEAVRTRSPVVETGGSMRSFLESIGFDYNGNTRFKNSFKQQMMALAACRMTLAFWNNGRVKQTKADPIHAFDAWFPADPAQQSLWADHIQLGQEFFETLCEHAVPLDTRAIHALKGSALDLDNYTWMANRLHRVKKGGQFLSWRNLKVQFGQEYKTSKDFKKAYRKSLLKVRAVYPDARLEERIGGLMLYNSPPPISKRQVVVDGKFTMEGRAKRIGKD